MFYEQINCTNEKLDELAEVYKDNPFLMFCVQLHNWAMDHDDKLLYHEDPYILKDASIPIMPELPIRPVLKIKRPGKYAFSVDSESKAKTLQKEAIAVLKANNKDKKGKPGKLKLNLKVLPAFRSVKLSIAPAFSVKHCTTDVFLDYFEDKIFDIQEQIEHYEKDSPDNENIIKELKEEEKALNKQINEWYEMFKKRGIEKLTVAYKGGNQFRFTYYNPLEEKRCQVGFGDVIIFYGSPEPTLSIKEPSKKRTDTRDNSDNMLYHGDFNGIEAYISI